jgi:uncharacterized protein
VLPDRVLLGAISVVVLYGAVEVWRYQRPREGDGGEIPAKRDLLVNAALIGLGVGVLGGFVGLILGSLRLPALVRRAGVSPYAAVGTSAAVGAVVGVGGLFGTCRAGSTGASSRWVPPRRCPPRTWVPTSPAGSTSTS